MKKEISKRVIQEADRLLATKKTLRELAKEFNLSKSTIHKDLHERLMYIDKNRYDKIQEIMQYHIQIRHLRGGESTKKKYTVKKR